ncbi:peptide ABC transporter substrate-binding protein [Mobilicoccus massiliensis]|uniref:peptide ABC transporter substrate-binding protein n=1 Tax=Mobilicoccus massiliensis TaxID=1522310 RepID=UPI00058E0EFA|nr:ABC transporter substrate-binding protein [Mobilicoccus massiliensis]
MQSKTRAALVASLSATALLAACGGGGGDAGGGGGTAGGGGAGGGEIVVRGCQPQNPLIGGDTGESCGHDIVELFASTLFSYDPKTGEPRPDIAQSVESDDNQHFTVKIKGDRKFSDGTPVTAKSFVDAWNYTAYGPNAQYLSYFMSPIKGYEDVSSEDPDGEDGPKKAPEPKAKTMSGLKVVDDTTFTIETTEPISNLPVRLGYTAFAPQPESFFKDPEAFGKAPIGAGPYKVDTYEQGRQAVLSKNPQYNGEFGGKVDKITFRIYQDSEAAYNDLMAGNLDVTDEIPASALVGKKYQQDLPDRWAQEAYPAIQTVTFAPEKVSPEYANPKLRQAISMAIDRQKVINDQFDGARQPADGWVAPGVEGYKAGACGEFCKFDPAKAKQLLQEAGGFNGKLTISYNADSAHKDWVTATCNSIRTNLGIDCVATPVTDFATFRDQIGSGKMKGMFRSGWIADYPHIENFLTPLFSKGGSSNDGKYDNPEFDKKLVEAGKQQGDASLAAYQEAEKMLAADMPAIPMWYYTATIGWSEKAGNVSINKASGRPDLLQVTVNQ